MNKYSAIADKIATDPLWKPGDEGDNLADKMSRLQKAANQAVKEHYMFAQVSSAMSVQLGSRSEVMIMTRQIETMKKTIYDVQGAASQALNAVEELQDAFGRTVQDFNR